MDEASGEGDSFCDAGGCCISGETEEYSQPALRTLLHGETAGSGGKKCGDRRREGQKCLWKSGRKAAGRSSGSCGNCGCKRHGARY